MLISGYFFLKYNKYNIEFLVQLLKFPRALIGCRHLKDAEFLW